MPTLDWVGKSKVVNHHLEVPYCVLDRKYSFDKNGKHDEDNGSDNMVIHGDNLLALKSLLPQYEGRIKCIYIDPPYNTGNENWIYNDNVNDPRIRKWLGEVVGKEGEDLSRHDKWLCMMYPRLKLLQRLLADDGAIFISIGDDEFATLKLICDEIFGIQNMIANFVWKSRSKPSNTGIAKINPQNDAEYILCYGKSCSPLFQLVRSGKERSYPHHDKDGNYRLQTILKSNRGESRRETMTFEDTIKDLYARNRITFQTGEPMLKYYEHEENAETSPFYCFVERKDSSTAENGKKLLNSILGNSHGFDTVKPLEIITYLLDHSINCNDIVLDSFAGSGTTAHAVLNMNKADGGHRKFILVEMEDYADSITAERVKRVIKGYGEGKNAVEGTGGDFSFYELGEPIFKDDKLNQDVDISEIRKYVYFTETKQKISASKLDEPYYMGTYMDVAYYFYYDRDNITTLNRDFLHTVKTKAEGYVIYADLCTLSTNELEKWHITFKKIPRDISKV